MLPRAPGKENIWRDGWGKKRGKRKILRMFCEKATMLGTEQAGEGGRKKNGETPTTREGEGGERWRRKERLLTSSPAWFVYPDSLL